MAFDGSVDCFFIGLFLLYSINYIYDLYLPSKSFLWR